MYPSIIMRSCLSFMGKHNIRTKVIESVFFSANPLLNIFTQTLSLKSHKKSICGVFTCAPFQMLQLHGKTSRKYMYTTETCNSCSVIFHFSVIHPKDQCRTENLSLFQIDDQVNQPCPQGVSYIWKIFGGSPKTARRLENFVYDLESTHCFFFFFTSYLIYLYLCYNE